MRKFPRSPVSLLLILVLLLSPVLTVSVRAADIAGKYDPYTEGIVSSYYHIDREKGFLTGIAPGTTAQQLTNVCLPAGATLSQDNLATGAALTVTCAAPLPPETDAPAEASNSEAKTHTLTLIVTGDLNGDGNVTITDMLMLKSAILGEELSATAAAAGDINYDGKITITDFLKVKSCLLGIETVSAGWPADAVPSDTLILTTPGSQESWPVSGAVAYASDNDTVAAIDETGAITAGSGEGSSFVYALDEAGGVIARAIVTVLNEKLTVSLGADSHRLVLGQSLALTPRFNHPVTAPVTWASSDPAVATVDGSGNVTAKGLGSATVTATLPNGSEASVAISVVPPIEAIAFDRSLYKIKPGNSRALGVILTPADTGEELIWSSSNSSVATVSSDGTVTGVAMGTATITVKGKYGGLSASCSVKICNVKQVAITFDDGPSVYTADLLKYLRESGIKATFFMVGNRLQEYSGTVKQMVADGHEIGYHSYAHTLQSYISLDQVASDFKNSNQILKDLTGAEFTVWRAPGGDYNDRILKKIPLPHIGWSVDTRDWETQSTDSNYRAILSARDGDIILLHDLYSPSVNGAIKAMKEMLAGDYEFLTVTELLSRNGDAPQKHTHYDKG